MEGIAKLLGTTTSDLENFLLSQVNKAIAFGFSEKDAKEMMFEALREQLGLKK